MNNYIIMIIKKIMNNINKYLIQFGIIALID